MELPLTSSGRRNNGEMGRVTVPALPAGMFVSFFSDGTRCSTGCPSFAGAQSDFA